MMGRATSTYTWRLAVLGLAAALGIMIWSLWLGVNSDKDNIHPILNQLIPAGHCACEASTIFKCDSCLQCSSQLLSNDSALPPASDSISNVFDSEEYSYSQTQCRSFLPGYFEDLTRAQLFWNSKHGITRADLDNIKMVNGMARAAIYNRRLYVIKALANGEDHRRKIIGILSSIHRALISSPEYATIPNTEFIFSVEDKMDDVAGPGHPLWVLARKAKEESVWLMPDFGYWSWGHIDSRIGPYDQVIEHVRQQELPWEKKQDKLVWRGKLSFAPKLRRTLLEVTRKHPWGDVKEIEWKNKANFLSMEDHCNYRFIAHVEGRSYSASLKYRQACRSVIVIHKLQYIQHHHYLLVSSGPYQNYVQVERDFSDLPQKIQDLLDNPAKAQQIANNNVNVFRERYLTPAANVCYWRELLHAWMMASPEITATVTDPTREPKRSYRYESFILLQDSSMMHFVL
ncbi:glycosyl transferase family 90-domain-containing protein [Aspergillus alliaceus]|uniref:Glycosyl transferase family 90-domain-containing protein n=1 Tax=Petromyces alliaceus TaxID=209559 RepID=A0A5N7CBS8_PETAA|nr:glycosyl transferase family 90-domain-containing protein [Aspergillus alliaceus]